MSAEVRAFAELGVKHLAPWFKATDPAELAGLVARFDREIASLV